MNLTPCQAVVYLDEQYALAESGRTKAATGATLTADEQAAMRATSASGRVPLRTPGGSSFTPGRWLAGDEPGPDDWRSHP